MMIRNTTTITHSIHSSSSVPSVLSVVHSRNLHSAWAWNIWGRDCVVVHFRKGGTLRIGTDDAENLAAFLGSRVVT